MCCRPKSKTGVESDPIKQTKRNARRAEAVAPSDELAQVRNEHGEPPAAAIASVRRFYAPFNAQLAEQLNDRAFLWGEPA